MKKDFWERNAENWNQVITCGNIQSRKVTNAAIVKAIKNLHPNSVLDLGCGEGWLFQKLNPEIHCYLGIDGSRALIEIASAKHGNHFENVSYSDIRREMWRPKQKFDLAVFNFSLMEEEISDLLKAVASFLNQGGALLIQTLHPSLVSQDGWKTEDFKSMEVPFDGHMPWFGRTLPSWRHLLSQSGFRLDEIIEPVSEGKPASIIFQVKL